MRCNECDTNYNECVEGDYLEHMFTCNTKQQNKALKALIKEAIRILESYRHTSISGKGNKADQFLNREDIKGYL